MKFSDPIRNKDAKSITPYLTRATIAEAVEISASGELSKKLDEIKQTLSKSSSSKFIVVAYKI
jgi:hypothetical protein